MAHIITNSDGTFRAAYRGLTAEDLIEVEEDAKSVGAVIAEVSLTEMRSALETNRAAFNRPEILAFDEVEDQPNLDLDFSDDVGKLKQKQKGNIQ
jgi:hypothetical protein